MTAGKPLAGFNRAVVIGGGTMGAGIAENLLLAVPGALHVTVMEASADLCAAARDRIVRAIEKHPDGRAAEDAIARLALITAPGQESGEPDLVFEAVPENEELKLSVLRAAGSRWPEAIIASNTSSLSLTRLAQVVSAPRRFIGMHFFNPVPRSALVELVVPEATAEETVARCRELIAALGKEVIRVADFPGFATSRLGVAMGLEAIRMVEQGVASAADIDKGMVLGYRFPMGPLKLTDLVGLDVRLAVAEHLHSELGPRFEPPQLMRDMVAAGRLGKKSGQGFYAW